MALMAVPREGARVLWYQQSTAQEATLSSGRRPLLSKQKAELSDEQLKPALISRGSGLHRTQHKVKGEFHCPQVLQGCAGGRRSLAEELGSVIGGQLHPKSMVPLC